MHIYILYIYIYYTYIYNIYIQYIYIYIFERKSEVQITHGFFMVKCPEVLLYWIVPSFGRGYYTSMGRCSVSCVVNTCRYIGVIQTTIVTMCGTLDFAKAAWFELLRNSERSFGTCKMSCFLVRICSPHGPFHPEYVHQSWLFLDPPMIRWICSMFWGVHDWL